MKITLAEQVESFGRSPLFRSLRHEELKALVMKSENFIYDPGELIVGEGEEGDQAFVICRGSVEVWRQGQGSDRKVVAVLGAGEIFGELALFGDSFRTASVTAVEETFVAAIAKEKLFELLRNSPEVAIELLKVLARRLARAGTTG